MEAAIFLSQLLHQCYKEFEGSEGTVISKPMAETDVKKDKESGGGNTLLYTIFHCEICGTFLEFVTFSFLSGGRNLMGKLKFLRSETNIIAC